MTASNKIVDSAKKIKAIFKDQVQTTFLSKLSQHNSNWTATDPVFKNSTKIRTKFINDFEPKMEVLINEVKENLSEAELIVLKEHLNTELLNQSNHHDYLLSLFLKLPFVIELVIYNNRVWCRVIEKQTEYVFNLAFQHNNKDLLKIAYGNNVDAYSDQTLAFEMYCNRCGADLDQLKKLIDVLICYWKKGDYKLFVIN